MTAPQDQIPLTFTPRTALGEEDFLIAPCNEEACLWIGRWPDWPEGRLIVCGPPHSGKTHLGRLWQNRSGAKYVDAAEVKGAAVDRLADSHLVIEMNLDDDGTVAWEDEAAFHLLNLCRERGHSILMLARKPVAGWNISLADLQSRLLASPVSRIGNPDEAMVCALLVKLFSDRQLVVGQDVVHFLSLRLPRNFKAAHDAVEKLDRLALAERKRITVPLAGRVLAMMEDREK